MRIALCDDDKVFLNELKNKIYEYSNEHNLEPVVDAYTYGNDLINSDVKYDIIILDYQMDKLNGIETAKKLRKGINEFTCIIFLTNFPDISIDAYSVDTYRFVLKNTLWEGLFNALNDYRKHKTTNKFLSVKSAKDYITIDTSDIVFIDSQSRTSSIHLLGNNVIETKTPLTSLYEKLPHTDFFRVHKSFVVNFKYIVRRDFSSINVSGYEYEIPVSRNFTAKFKEAYYNFLKD